MMKFDSLAFLLHKCLNRNIVLCLLFLLGLHVNSYSQQTTLIKQGDSDTLIVNLNSSFGIITGTQLNTALNPSGMLFYENNNGGTNPTDTNWIKDDNREIFVIRCDTPAIFVNGNVSPFNGSLGSGDMPYYGIPNPQDVDTLNDYSSIQFFNYSNIPVPGDPTSKMTIDSLQNGTISRIPLTGSGSGIGVNSGRIYFKIRDIAKPMAICKNRPMSNPDTVYLDSLGLITAKQLDSLSSDNCTPPDRLLFTIAQDTIRCDSVGKSPFKVVLTVTDEGGNSDTCSSYVVVKDTLGPFLIGIPNDTMISCDRPIPAQASITIIDNCTPTANLTNVVVDSVRNYRDTITRANPQNYIEYYNYDVVYYYTATDEYNNVSVDSQVVMVRDKMVPHFTIGTRDTLYASTIAGATTCSAQIALDIDQIVADNCSDSVRIHGFKTGTTFVTTFPKDTVLNLDVMMGDTTVYLDVEDIAGNRGVIDLTIIVDDNTDPNPVCNNVALTINSLGFVVVTPQIIGSNSTDNCDGQPVHAMWIEGRDTFLCADVGQTFMVQLQTRDKAGNTAGCQASVSIQDFTGSNVFACPNDTTVSCGHSLDPVLLGLPSVVDVCGTDDTTFYRDNTITGGTQPICVVVERTWVSRDINGTETTCIQRISLIDSIAPSLDTSYADALVTCIEMAGTSDGIRVTDNCAATYMSIAKDSIRCSNDTIYYRRIWEATDGCNTVADTQMIRINDKVAPTIAFPDSRDTFTYYTADGDLDSCGVFVSEDLTKYVNDCNQQFGLTVTWDSQDTTVLHGYFTVGYQTVTVKAKDICGNESSKTLVVQVIDNTRPTLVCVTNLNLSLGTGGTGILTVEDVLSSIQDNCGDTSAIDTIYLSQTLFDCTHLGINNVTLTARDTSGNVSTCMVVLEVTSQGTTNNLSIEANAQNEMGIGENNGMAWVEVTGGSGNYTILWTPSNATTDTIRNLAPGLYTVRVSDTENSCRLTDTVRVNAGTPPHYTLGMEAGGVGETIQIPVIVSGFDSVAGFEMKFVLSDTTVATFVKENPATGFNFPGLTNTAFQYQNAGELDMTSLPSLGTTLSDGSTLFLVNVQLVGTAGAMTDLIIQPLNSSMIETTIIVDGSATTFGAPNDTLKLTIQDNTKFAGNIHLEDGDPLEDVTVTLSGDATGTDVTDANGDYEFSIVPGQNLSVRPSENRNHKKGLNVTDLAIIQGHILGMKMTSPYRILAADVNNSKTITVTDLAQIQAVILEIIPAFPVSPSWKFIPADFVLNAANPWANPIPDSIATISENADFIAIKMGDANGSAATINLTENQPIESRSTFQFGIEDRLLKKGEIINVPFKARNFKDMYAYQMTLSATPGWLSFESVEAGALTDINKNYFGLSKEAKGLISTLWYSAEPLNIEQNTTLFTISFRVNQGGKYLSDILRASSETLSAEAYATNVEAKNVSLFFEENTRIAGFELFQNKPNPFSTQTTISFNVPKATAATLRFYDFSGRMVHQIKGDYGSGLNNVVIQKQDLEGSGVLYYELETPTFTARKKMIVLD